MDTEKSLEMVKEAAPVLACTKEEARNTALEKVREALLLRQEEIFAANKKDIERSEKEGIAGPILKRLVFDDHKLHDVTQGISDLISLPDPLFKIQLDRELDTDLHLYRETCPIGVIGVIFEARPDALVQISALCIKSGNCAVLKGGREAMETNRILFQTIQEAVVAAGLPEHCLLQMEDRTEISEMLSCDRYVDLLIPRGSNAFVQYIMDNTRIPVMGHSSGICHIYVDKDADIAKAIPVICDAKTQYVSACNTVETLLVHKDIAEKLLLPLAQELKEKHVELRGDEMIRKILADNPVWVCNETACSMQQVPCEAVTAEDDAAEYLDYIISMRTVDRIEDAVEHINRYGSHHTDAIITEDKAAADYFMRMVDSAGVYQNCSTRFADGFRYGFGAEVGISTGKLHARGPVGLEGLVSYKYKLFGNGQTVGDYAEGRKQFRFVTHIPKEK